MAIDLKHTVGELAPVAPLSRYKATYEAPDGDRWELTVEYNRPYSTGPGYLLWRAQDAHRGGGMSVNDLPQVLWMFNADLQAWLTEALDQIDRAERARVTLAQGASA